jgi:sugar/nucleoside kinase (ribokinase family)
VTRFGRLLHLGNVVVDVVLNVAEIPERGGDVLASSTEVAAGGGFNVMAAAVAQGLAVGYAGGYGSGPFAALALAALARARVEVLLAPKPGLDTGFVVTIVDAGGERTFLTSRGAEATLTAPDLRVVRAGPRDAVYLSGYGLVHPSNARAILDWLGRLGEPNLVFLDPGPLVGDVPSDVLDRVLRRTDWLTCNEREAAWLTGEADPVAAARALAAGARGSEPRHGAAGKPRHGASGGLEHGAAHGPLRGAATGAPPFRGRGGVVVRTGAAGCLLAQAGAGPAPLHVPGFRVPVIDTNGAGDIHTGTFIAVLARGGDAREAARIANAAAAISVTRRGPAAAPTEAELADWLAAR